MGVDGKFLTLKRVFAYTSHLQPVSALSTKEVILEKSKAILAGILAGLASPASIAQQTHYQRLQGSDLSRMRGDVSRVGLDFQNVITHQYGKKAKHTSASQSA